MIYFALPPNSTYKCRRLFWEPLTKHPSIHGIMEIRESVKRGSKDKVRRYLIQENDFREDGRVFLLTKSPGSAKYNVQLTVHGICDCTGFLQDGVCVHITALRLLVERGYLPRV